MGIDFFANIAKQGIGGRLEQLIYPEPMKSGEKKFYLNKEGLGSYKTKPKMSSKEELYKELEVQRKKYQPFLQNLAPEVVNQRKRYDLVDFIYNHEIPITIPHYGGPLGYASATYTTNFSVGEVLEDEAVFLCFKGADYKATVYVNHICVGQHEGFFSPFEFEVAKQIREGINELEVFLENDYIYLGNAFADQEKIQGDKLYAATGLGYDDALKGWHHCPPGMGIYNDVYVEVRKRIFIQDIYVRPLIEEEAVEIWTEVYNCDYTSKEVELMISIYGQNFKETIVENYKYRPVSIKTVGVGDSLTEAKVKADGLLHSEIPLLVQNKNNVLKCKINIPNMKLWTPDTPYLYQVQVEIKGDKLKCQVGLRSFHQDLEEIPKGMFYLNGKKIKLRGANTMGFEQQDVLKKDMDQLIDDILLGKICNMNFFRLTQRPVQEEIYDYCDRLGLMTQTDLPLFGCMRRTKFSEGIRQAEEMIKMIRSHPCNVIISYINEPFPNANNEPHRHLERHELECFFAACDNGVKLYHPDQVIKHVDGDYDPPNERMPDNHCYPMWYNGHGIDIGRLYKGHWLAVKPDWFYGCGEYGAEGLDFPEIMMAYYPKEWVREPFHPKNIIGAQTSNFHYFFYDTQDTMENWVVESHKHQEYATKIMTEAFRRDRRMVTFAIHLFIDAWPSGWMKTIMDFKRNPKPAFFSYRNALEPVLISLRADKFKYYDNEEIAVDCWICNDTNLDIHKEIAYELYKQGQLILSGADMGECLACDTNLNHTIVCSIPKVSERTLFQLKAVMGENIYEEFEFEVFPKRELFASDHVIWCQNDLSKIKEAKGGKTVVVEKLSPGIYKIGEEKIEVKPCGMMPVHFVSRNTGHELVASFQKEDFKMWHDKQTNMITPLAESTFTCLSAVPILTSGNMNDKGQWHTALVAGEIPYGKGRILICQLDLMNRLDNPVAGEFYQTIMRREQSFQ